MTLHSAKARTGRIVSPRPNWAEAVVEEYAFSTEIFTSRDGTEQRNAARLLPRVTVEYTSDQTGQRALRLTTDAKRQMDGDFFIVPIRWRTVTLDSSLSASDTTISVTEVPWWLAEGGYMVLESDTATEAVEITDITGTTITIAGGLTNDFAVTDLVMLGLEGRLQAENNMRAALNIHKRAPLRFDVEPGTWDVTPPPGNVSMAHEGYPVMIKKPNWTDVVSFDTMDMREVVDNGKGVPDVQWPVDFLGVTQSWNFTAMTQDDVDELIGFFNYVRGRQKPFWVPSQLHELDVAQTATGKSVIVEGQDVIEMDGDPLHGVLCVRWDDGCVQFNRIDGFALTGDNTAITVRDTWERDITPGTQLSWGYFARMATDILRVEWVTDQAANVKWAIKPLPADWIDTLDPNPPEIEFIGYYGSQVKPWTDQSSWPFGIIDPDAVGIPPGLHKRELVTTSATFTCHIPATGTETGTVTLRIYFFDSSGDEIDPSTQRQDVVSFNRNGGTINVTASVSPWTIPASCAEVRYRATVTRGFEDGVGIATTSHKQWGLILDMENEKCL